MTSSAQVHANRRNARKSTGPKTRAGKQLSARNARRHGLASEQPRNAHVESVARWITGLGDDDALRLSQAKVIAEAQLELCRIRAERHKLLTQAHTRAPPAAVGAGQQLESEHALEGSPTSTKDGGGEALECDEFDSLTLKLERLERYERRALSRRKFAIRDWETRYGSCATLDADDASVPEQHAGDGFTGVW